MSARGALAALMLTGTMLTVPASASAHFLTGREAAKAAKAEARNVALRYVRNYDGWIETVIARRKFCIRYSAHVVKCAVGFQVSWTPSAECVATGNCASTVQCTGAVRVWLREGDHENVWYGPLRQRKCEWF